MYLSEIEVGRLQGQEPFVVRFHDPMHLCDLFLRILGKYQSGKAGKIAIDFIDSNLVELNGFLTNQNIPDCPLNVVGLYKSFDLDTYDKATENKRKIMIWEGLFSSLELCCKKFCWNFDPIINTYHRGIELNLINEYFFLDAKKSPNKKFSARVFCIFTMDSFKSYAVFYNMNGLEVKRELLLDEPPSFGWYEAHSFKQAKWLSEKEFALFDKYGNKWIASLKSDTI